MLTKLYLYCIKIFRSKKMIVFFANCLFFYYAIIGLSKQGRRKVHGSSCSCFHNWCVRSGSIPHCSQSVQILNQISVLRTELKKMSADGKIQIRKRTCEISFSQVLFYNFFQTLLSGTLKLNLFSCLDQAEQCS